MTSKFMTYVDRADFKNLFIEELGWDQPTAKPLTVEMNNSSFHVTPVAGFNGLHVWACGSLPDRSTQAQIDREVSATSTERLIIFHDGSKQEWRWPRYNKNRGTNMSKLLVHEHTIGNDHSALERRLEKIALDIDHEISLVQLLEKMRTAFDVEESEESSKAAKVMAKLYYELEAHLPQEGPEAAGNLHKISVTMTRILFLVFADDTMMWDEENLFQNFVAFETNTDGSDLTAKLEQLFNVLNTEEKNRTDVSGYLVRFKYVNGGIFSEEVKLPDLGLKMRELLLEASRFDWGNISPAIFGSMFQAVKSKELRRELGAHYTSEKDILKTLKPLFLDELHEEFERAKKLKDPTRPLRVLRERLGQLKILDPACGCGNFLIVAYRELRELELQIMEALQEYRGDDGQRSLDATIDLRVSMTQIFGIEIDEWPARIAETALHLMDRQCNLRLIEKFGQAPERLPISEAAKITVADALRIDWSDIVTADEDTVVVGNPPFLGKTERNAEQTASMKAVWGKDYSGETDFVTSWFIRARQYLDKVPGRFAFVSTNSIVQGTSVPPLFGKLLTDGWRIRFAHRTFLWKSEATRAAQVHCVIVGFDRENTPARLFDYPSLRGEPIEIPATATVNGYLVDADNFYVAERSAPLNPLLASPIGFGSMPGDGGHLFLEHHEAEELLKNPATAAYVKRFIGAKELIRDKTRWCIWMPEPDHQLIMGNAILRDHITRVREWRSEPGRDKDIAKNADKPSRFHRPKQPSTNFLCIPRHFSENRDYATVAYFTPEVVPGDATFTTSDPDGFLFAVISSKMFMTWQKTVGGRLKSDPRFSSTLTWNNYPLPNIDGPSRQRLIKAGKGIILAREAHPTSSLDQLYSPQNTPSDLLAAHDELDRVTDRLFGFAKPPALIQRQERLFERFLERIG